MRTLPMHCTKCGWLIADVGQTLCTTCWLNGRAILRIAELARIYKTMPYRGARLTLSSGKVSDGMSIVAKFESDAAAIEHLNQNGFRKIDGGHWKLA